MHYPRQSAARLVDLARFFPAVVLSGARQSGKTTLLRGAFSKHRYVSLDLPSVAEQAERNPAQFLAENPAPLLVDEVQYAPGLFRHLKAAIDRDRHAMGRFILTGSQHFTLMKGIAESLAGRCGIAELENLSHAEISTVIGPQDARKKLLALMVRGQFPELWRVRGFPRKDFFSAYLATYLERDVRQILNVTSLRDFERFLRILATRSGAMLNKSDVARDVGVSVKAIGDWVSVLQASGQIILLEPWFANLGKRIVKTPKVYFRDSGLLCFLLNIEDSDLPGSPALGAVWETFLFSELRKLNATLAKPMSFWYYRDQRAREIDFVLERGGRLSFIECKWQENPGKDDARHILAVHEDLAKGSSAWRSGTHWVIGTPKASYSIAAGLAAGALRDLPLVLGG
jgi:predicted AAA+ superfamily ATPase